MLTQLSLPKLQIPFLCHGQFMVRVLVVSQAVAVVLAFAPGVYGDVWARLGFISVFVHWISIITTLCLCAARHKINQLKPISIISVVLCIFLTLTLIVSAVAFSLFSTLFNSINHEMSEFLAKNLMVAFIVALVAVQFLIVHAEKSEQLNAQTHAELNALQARIQPHFLFNTLNTVAELTHIDADAAEKSLLALSALFRAALDVGKLVPLQTELELAKQYLSLEQWRLGRRMNVNWQIPDALPAIQIPALTIQPLLENAIRYGIENSTEAGKLNIFSIESRNALTIVITNPYYQSIKSSGGNGIALDNIRQRLMLQYGSSASLTFGNSEGLYRVKLVIPKS
ncbi:sensor histidine kinase [Rheinheimera baltica]|uniref:sensor histidine kinase n=1 Tax=Rheinheimera baltica TaxID=67576 RepID=UPI0006869DE5|nr:histidine kinase [Rheinheimera baltica]